MKTDSYSELELIERARTDMDAFGELVERYRNSIQRQCFSRTSDWQHAEDLAQETFVRAYLKLHQITDLERFPNWLRKIASNVCNEFLRSPVRSEMALVVPEDGCTPDSRPSEITGRLSCLPEETRVCLELFYEQGLSYREIADTMGTSIASVKGRLSRAKAVLREEMADMAPAEQSAFTSRVIEKLRQLQHGDQTQRTRAAGELRLGLAEDIYQRTLSRLRGDFGEMEARISCEDERAWILEREIRNSRRYRTPEVRDALVDLMLSHEFEELRLKAAGALVAQRDPAAIPSLRKAIEDPQNPREVVAAAKSAIRQLEESVPGDRPERAGQTLRADLQAAATDRQSRFELMKRLAAALGDSSARVRSQAAKALAELGDKRAVPDVAKLVLADPAPGVRQAAMITLGKLGSPKGLPALLKVTEESEDRKLLQPAILALTLIGDHRAVTAVLRLITRFAGDNNILHAGMRLVVKLASADDIYAIREAVDTFGAFPGERQREFVESRWLEVLAKHADDRHAPDLLEALKRHPENCELARALGRACGVNALDILRDLLMEHGNYGAAVALIGLGQAGVPVIKDALRSGGPSTREAIYGAILWGGGHTVLDAEMVGLVRRLSEEEAEAKLRLRARAILFNLDRPWRWSK